MRELSDNNKLELTKCRRSDDTLFNLCLPENLRKAKKDQFGKNYCERHIAFTNLTRVAVNSAMMNNFIKKKRGQTPLELEKLPYDDNSQDVRLLSGMPIIARVNEAKHGICNNDQFTIQQIQHKTGIIIVQDEERTIKIPFTDFQRLFRVGFCITCHAAQGSTFDFEYTIHEWDKFCPRLKYVALSRGTKIENINVV